MPKTKAGTVRERVYLNDEWLFSHSFSDEMCKKDYDEKDPDALQKLISSMNELTDAMDQLLDGAKALNDGLDTLLAKSKDLTNGVSALCDGADQVASGAGTLKTGAEKLASGTRDVKNGADQLAAGAGSLLSGADQVAGGAARRAGSAQRQLCCNQQRRGKRVRLSAVGCGSPAQGQRAERFHADHLQLPDPAQSGDCIPGP